jgi:release factor glutamine methyltransferase
VVPDGLEASVAERLGSRQEARWLVEHVHGDAHRALALAERRAAGEPLQYVLGRWAFRSLELSVDPRVLIPRPETEQVVEVALAELASLIDGGSADPRGNRVLEGPVCLDLGTGSGAIALSLAVEGGALASDLVVWATDSSRDALDVAADNLEELGHRDRAAADRVRLAEGRWFDALPADLAGRVDLLVSNPPYIAEADFPSVDPTVRWWEPREALVAADAHGVGGMADIETIIVGASRWLRPTGVLVIEIDPGQAEATLDAARRAGWSRCGTRRDLTGRVRMVVVRR